MDDDEDQDQQSPVSGRSAHFGAGLLSGSESSPGLQASAQRFMASVPTSYRPSGSGNGMSAEQATATMSGQLPVQDGQSDSTYLSKKWFGPRGN
jgi:hypothetical protein